MTNGDDDHDHDRDDDDDDHDVTPEETAALYRPRPALLHRPSYPPPGTPVYGRTAHFDIIDGVPILLSPEERARRTAMQMHDYAEREHMAEDNEWYRIREGIDGLVWDAIDDFHAELIRKFRPELESELLGFVRALEHEMPDFSPNQGQGGGDAASSQSAPP